MPPLLLDLATDDLVVILNNANDMVEGALGNADDKCISMLQYVDDTICLLQDDIESAKK